MSGTTTPIDSSAPVLVWFRQDLRLADNAALTAAAASGRPLLPVYILEDDPAWPWGGASRWWLHRSLAALTTALAACGLPLILRRGAAPAVLAELAAALRPAAVHWNRRYEPDARRRDQAAAALLGGLGVAAHEHPGALLVEPEDLATVQGGPYQVFTPYYKRFLDRRPPGPPLPPPSSLAAPRTSPPSLALDELALAPAVDWAGGLRAAWTPGEAGAQAALDGFLPARLERYDHDRDFPAGEGTSRLAPHLHWGEISPRQVWAAAAARDREAAAPFLRQLVWREFAHHLLHHFPHTPEAPLRAKYAAFPWDGDPGLLASWQRGRTGYPLVDAGMRQLWRTGWMHNRVRMVAGSFLVKHLLLPWQDGACWFWDTLVDADLANNTFGWQWTAGCGADAAPYFRIFNPVAQGRRFDAGGDYVRRWVPELAGLPAPLIHAPWTATPAALAAGGVRLGRDYPRPVVDHAAARRRALDSFGRMQAG